jgi:hypothetical protein
MTTISLELLCDTLSANVSTFSTLKLSQINTLLSLLSHLKNEILLAQPATHPINKAPDFLPPAIIGFVSDCCSLDNTTVGQCWSVVKDTVWDNEIDKALCLSETVIEELYRHYGPQYGFSKSSLSSYFA